MTSRTLILILGIVISAFTLITGLALADVGYFGIFEPHFQSWGGAQVFTYLLILALLSCFWMKKDSHTSGLSAWPFIGLTFVADSFGILLYLFVRARKSGNEAIMPA